MIISSIAAFLSTLILICTVAALAVAFPYFARATENASLRKLPRTSEPTLLAVEPALEINQAIERLTRLEKEREKEQGDAQFRQAMAFLRSLSETKASQKLAVRIAGSDLQAGPVLEVAEQELLDATGRS